MHTARLSQFGSSTAHESAPPAPGDYLSWRYWRALQPAWFYSAAAYLLLTLACLAAALVDERLFNGVSVWHKPFKFALSISVYFATLVVFAQYTAPGFLNSLQGRILVAIPVVMALGEMVYITWQGAMGEASHFNVTTTFHQVMYSLMGFGATCMVAVLVWFAWAIGRHQSMHDPLMLGIVIGLVATFLFGGGFGGYMGGQTSHWVAANATDANGVAFFNWARDGGDLRVAHFFGMHAMQAVPLFALLLAKGAQKFFPTTRNNMLCTLVLAFTAAYCAFTTVTFVQAVQGLPFIS